MPSALSVYYLGIELVSPIIVGACPLTTDNETVRHLVAAGAGAIVLPSMLQEQLVHHKLQQTDPVDASERSGYQPQQDKYNGGVDQYLATIRSHKKSFAVPIIGSLNGSSIGQWLDYAKEIESAGADALELNLQSAVFGPETSSASIELNLCDMVAETVRRVSIPVAVKITPRYTNLASMARRLREVGAKGIVLFTHSPHWDVDIDRMHWTIRWELSPVGSVGGILEGIVRVHSGNVGLSIAASGGVATTEDAIKTMIAGADAVMATSAVYRQGPDMIRQMADGIQRYLEINHYPSLLSFLQTVPKPQIDGERMIRLEHIDPLIRSMTYVDPTPTVSQTLGDAFGHRL